MDVPPLKLLLLSEALFPLPPFPRFLRSGQLPPRLRAARVVDAGVTTDVVADPRLWRHLAELHSAPPWLWRSLARRTVRGAQQENTNEADPVWQHRRSPRYLPRPTIDPTSVKVLLRPRVDDDPPSIEEFVYGTAPELVRESLGQFKLLWVPPQAGGWLYRWECAGRSRRALPGRGLVHGGQQRLLISTKMVSP
jgi:hypothetical protein